MKCFSEQDIRLSTCKKKVVGKDGGQPSTLWRSSCFPSFHRNYVKCSKNSVVLREECSEEVSLEKQRTEFLLEGRRAEPVINGSRNKGKTKYNSQTSTATTSKKTAACSEPGLSPLLLLHICSGLVAGCWMKIVVLYRDDNCRNKAWFQATKANLIFICGNKVHSPHYLRKYSKNVFVGMVN